MNHRVDALRREAARTYARQVYSIFWQAHENGETWLYCTDAINRLEERCQARLSDQNMVAILRHLRSTGYLRSVKNSTSNNKTKWFLHPQVVKLNKAEFGEPLSAEWSGCKTIQVDPRLAASSKAATASFTELEQYAEAKQPCKVTIEFAEGAEKFWGDFLGSDLQTLNQNEVK